MHHPARELMKSHVWEFIYFPVCESMYIPVWESTADTRLPSFLPFPTPQTFAKTIYYQLVKCCFNQLRLGWGPRGEARSFPPVAYSLGDSLPNPTGFSPLLSRMPALRPREAEAVVRSLGKGVVKGPTSSRSSPLNQSVDSINWASQAISTYQHMLSKGHIPDLSMLDK